jgi:hypothetical protein
MTREITQFARMCMLTGGILIAVIDDCHPEFSNISHSGLAGLPLLVVRRLGAATDAHGHDTLPRPVRGFGAHSVQALCGANAGAWGVRRTI